MDVEERFLELIQRSGADADRAHVLWDELCAAYSTRGRHYHNSEHLRYMMGQLEPIWSGLEDPDAVVLAVCYHDVVYNVARKDNEERSAVIMRRRMQGLHITDACLDRAQRHVLATKAHSAPRDADTQFLVDADLAILGAPAHAYDLYARSIRQEYRRYPGFLYVPGRRKVLLHFLSMPAIFCTPYFRERYEDLARSNLQRELDQLAGT